VAKKFAQAHRELTDWILAHPDEAKQMVRQELAAEMRAEVSPDLIAQAWKRIVLSTAVSPDEYQQFVLNAQRAGFLRTTPDLSRLIDKLD
jgi:NitT/TauT family transport system substrate-binding protein